MWLTLRVITEINDGTLERVHPGQQPYLDMLCALQEPLIKSTRVLVLLLLDFKVNIRLPKHLS